jgi:hypothetical protein
MIILCHSKEGKEGLKSVLDNHIATADALSLTFNTSKSASLVIEK